MDDKIVGAILIAAGVAAILLRRKLAPYTQGSLGAAGELRRAVETSWVAVGALAIIFGLAVMF